MFVRIVRIFVWAFFGGLFLTGCGERKPVSRYLRDLSPEDVLVRVNGRKILVSDYTVCRRLNDKLYRIKAKIDLDAVSEKASEHEKANEQRWPNELVRCELVRQEAERLGVTADEARLKAVWAKLLKSLKREKMSADKLLALLTDAEASFLKRQLEVDVLMEQLEERISTNDFRRVRGEEIVQAQESIRAFNERAKRNNERSRKKALEFREKVLAGGNFAELARKMGKVHVEEGEEWELSDVEAFPEDTPIRTWLETKPKAGELSQPMDFDDGLSVVGVVEVLTDGKLPDGTLLPDAYRLVRCTFHAYEYMREATTNQIVEAILKHRRSEAAKEVGSRILLNAKIDYPNGNELFPPVNAQKKKGAK